MQNTNRFMTDQKQIICRFAPSPNGPLHMGHAFSALLNYHFARQTSGRFLLRIEDIDQGRSREHFVRKFYDDLAWLGIKWEEPICKQSDKFAHYKKALDELSAQGLLYRCYATRSEIKAYIKDNHLTPPIDPDGAPLYPGLHKILSKEKIAKFDKENRPFALRLDIGKAISKAKKISSTPFRIKTIDKDGKIKFKVVNPYIWGDVILMRKDTPTSYHLSVCLDDHAQQITHVIRGDEFEQASALHHLLQILLGLDHPIYYHHPLIKNENGQKLSKSKNAPSLRALIDNDLTQKTLIAQLPLEEHLKILTKSYCA